MTTFQRARSDEQRLVRRQNILRTAAEMLAEMPLSALCLNELSRRVGLAKSNVLRYFASREAVLLDLLEESAREFLDDADEPLRARVDPSEPLDARIVAVASGAASAFAARPATTKDSSIAAIPASTPSAVSVGSPTAAPTTAPRTTAPARRGTALTGNQVFTRHHHPVATSDRSRPTSPRRRRRCG
ncbi:TetR family transcriptional regulator [Streptomyces sp. NBC_01261]|uniref:TetR/AcrR family transcriptional regulator n=1 Tax=Streptomyces sp. NBC_01261 TaxID=2903802 RepID=UPI002E379454|nr:TetR family transcriptional regulator [Streptomyces sp. NBC_01261]